MGAKGQPKIAPGIDRARFINDSLAGIFQQRADFGIDRERGNFRWKCIGGVDGSMRSPYENAGRQADPGKYQTRSFSRPGH